MQANNATRGPLGALHALNRKAREIALDLEHPDWSQVVDRGKPWEPQALGALGFLPSAASLSPAQRLRWKKALAAAMLRPMMRAWVSSARTPAQVLAQLGREYPDLRARQLPRLRTELRQVAGSPEYHRRLFSRAALPRSFALLAEYREHDRLWDSFPLARSERS